MPDGLHSPRAHPITLTLLSSPVTLALSPCHPHPHLLPHHLQSNSTLVLANRWGKRSRLREKLLWAVDDDGYYRRQGSGTHPAEATYEGYLQLTGELLDMEADGLRPLRRMEAEQSVKMEGVYTYVDGGLGKTEDVFRMPERNPNRHLLLDAFQRRLVHNARSVAGSHLNPQPSLWANPEPKKPSNPTRPPPPEPATPTPTYRPNTRSGTQEKGDHAKDDVLVRQFWNPMIDRSGVSAAQHPLPFHCPFDHVYDLEKWVHSDAPFREYSFLNNSRIPPADRADRVELGVAGAKTWPAGLSTGASTSPGGGTADDGSSRPLRRITMHPGDNYAAVREAIEQAGWRSAYVVQVDARSLELLCEDLAPSRIVLNGSAYGARRRGQQNPR